MELSFIWSLPERNYHRVLQLQKYMSIRRLCRRPSASVATDCTFTT